MTRCAPLGQKRTSGRSLINVRFTLRSGHHAFMSAAKAIWADLAALNFSHLGSYLGLASNSGSRAIALAMRRASGVTGRLNYVGASVNGLVGADERRAKNSAESREYRKGAPVRFQKAVSRSKEKRRGEAPIGAPVRVMGRLFPPAGGTGFAVRRATGGGVPHQRLSALRPLGYWGASPPW